LARESKNNEAPAAASQVSSSSRDIISLDEDINTEPAQTRSSKPSRPVSPDTPPWKRHRKTKSRRPTVTPPWRLPSSGSGTHQSASSTDAEVELHVANDVVVQQPSETSSQTRFQAQAKARPTAAASVRSEPTDPEPKPQDIDVEEVWVHTEALAMEPESDESAASQQVDQPQLLPGQHYVEVENSSLVEDENSSHVQQYENCSIDEDPLRIHNTSS
jgi:hypothetical protein